MSPCAMPRWPWEQHEEHLSPIETISPEDNGQPRLESWTLLLTAALGANPGVTHGEATEATSGLYMTFLSYLCNYLLGFIIKVGWTLHNTHGLYQGSG